MISVIIPVYNSAPYLEDCLRSISEQSYPDWECLIVDDASIDESRAICKTWCTKDRRFNLLNEGHNGAAHARNLGLAKARGDFVAFIDSDDYVTPSYLESLLHAISTKNSDLAVGGIVRKLLCGKMMVARPEDDVIFQLNNSNVDRFFSLCEKNLLYGPFAKLYRNALIKANNIQFDERYSYGEDLIFNVRYLRVVDTISTTDVCSYYYLSHEHDTLSTRFRKDLFKTDYEQWKELRSLFMDKGLLEETIAKQYLYKRLWGFVYDGIFLFPKLENPSAQYLNEILSIPEVDEMGKYASLFSCSKWIKIAILHRWSSVFHLYFKLFSRR